MAKRWQFWIDRGGTFTDCIAVSPTGEVSVGKLLSSDDAPLIAIRKVLQLPEDVPIPPVELRMGTTVATNALLERKGVATVFVTNRGLGDLLEIGDQSRPDIFALEINKPGPLAQRVVQVSARQGSTGEVIRPLDAADLTSALEGARSAGCESAAIALIHAIRNVEVEAEVARIAKAAGFSHVSVSHLVTGREGLVGRAATTVADAYLTPKLSGYLARLQHELPQSSIEVMRSDGGLAMAGLFTGKDAVLSGPAGGVVATQHAARACGFEAAIGFDMGGTSTDVCRVGERFEYRYENVVAGVPIQAPMLRIHTVAAGGGSICRYDGGRFTVGPDSCGANPGPLCYGAEDATDLAITDVNLFLGRVTEDHFPFPLLLEPVVSALEAIQRAIAVDGREMSLDEIAEGFRDVANSAMAQAIRKVSISRGHDVRTHALVVFGGAGGQHACGLADALDIDTVIVPKFCGALSALGIGLAPRVFSAERAILPRTLDATAEAAIQPAAATLLFEATAQLGTSASSELSYDLRYEGTQTFIPIAKTEAAFSVGEISARFEGQHAARFGYVRHGHPIEVVGVRIRAMLEPATTDVSLPVVSSSSPNRAISMFSGASRVTATVYERELLKVGTLVTGPAIIVEKTGTLVVEEGFGATAREDGHLLMSRLGKNVERVLTAERADPIQVEIFNNLYMSIAEQMGEVLRRTALSPNIRDRLDFSCAVFDRAGRLVANAPHIPVHLGAMGASIRGVLEKHPAPGRGDVYVTNDPARGGSHLPDITVITPVHRNDELLFFTASRGHHADVGGITPGSMPPFSRSAAEEGVVFDAELIVSKGTLDFDRLNAILSSGPHPARDPTQNIADLEAQIAANNVGATLLGEMVEKYGEAVVSGYMQHVQDNAQRRVEDAIGRLPNGRCSFEDALDDGTKIAVTIDITDRAMAIDFSGTGPQSNTNLNAPRAVTESAVLYVLRVLVGQPIPLNHGCFGPITLHVPPGSILSPDADRAVCGGNVETSQRVVDVLLGALELAAASQGTMNNLTFGNQQRGYYETIAGGAGATANAKGASAVHTHMTNTRMTDPEVLERSFPVRLERFAIRHGSGGAGRHPGGDGVVREIEFLAPMEVSILSERRSRPPFGLNGGEPGRVGVNSHNGKAVGAKTAFSVRAGDTVIIETPGGGAFGPG